MSSYHIQPLGHLPGGSFSSALAINNHGEVTGSAGKPWGRGEVERAVYWNRHAGLEELPIISRGGVANGSSQGLDIDDSARIVGDYVYGFANAYLWTRATGMVDLQTVPTGGGATCMNGIGQIAGDARVGNPGQAGVAGLWQNGQPFRIVVGGANVFWSEPWAINDYGIMVGQLEPPGTSATQAFIAFPGNNYQRIEVLGPYSVANDINNAGQVVGTINGRGFLWTEPGGQQDLGSLGGGYSSASAINDKGSIVGTSALASGEGSCFLYENGVMTDLQTLLPPGSPWVLWEAHDINDHGQIVGHGEYMGQNMGYILSPDILYQVNDFGRQIELTINAIIRHQDPWMRPFKWPFPDPNPGPDDWRQLYPQGIDSMILAAAYSLMEKLTDERLREQLQQILLPMLKDALGRMDK